tara:strand:- start:13459 stop:13911 length:453 start_codon:yes stop_codon:yes gene_type:complete
MGYLRKANIADLNHVCKHMRDMDRLEAVYQTGNEPEDALRLSYLSGQQVLAIAGDDDQPMGLCGVISDGCIWMICTDELFSNKKYRIQLIRKGRKWVDKLLQSYKVLYNFVYAENHTAIKWLKALGFTFVNYYEKYGDQEKPFYEFVRIA